MRGRRWRATDPSIPATLRQELVDALMAARRAVGVALRADDVAAEQLARARVHDAKTALGERGEPWWDDPTEEGRRRRIGSAVLALAGHRAPDRTICPSDVARAVGGDGWRSLMDEVREVVAGLAAEGEVAVSQRGRVLDPGATWRGPVRIRRQ